MDKIDKISNEFDYSNKVKGSFGKFWFERYPKNQQLYTRFSLDKYKKIKKNLRKGQRMLDVGVGFGDTFFLYKDYFEYFYGIDPSKEMVEIANYNIKKRNLKNCVVNKGIAKKLIYENSFFDSVFMLDVFEHIHPEDLDASLKEINRVMKQSATLYIATPSLKQIRFWSFFDNLLIKILINRKHSLKQFPQKKHYEKFYTSKQIKKILKDNNFIVSKIIKSSFYPAPENPGLFQKIIDKLRDKKLFINTIKLFFFIFEKFPFLRQKIIFIVKKT